MSAISNPEGFYRVARRPAPARRPHDRELRN